MKELLNNLKKTLSYKWRVQSCNEFIAICVAYIDSRDVQDLLDEVVGPENWQSDYKEVKGNVYAGIAININNNWVWKWDCGTESNTEKEKGEASDSFKRAAVKWGVGRFLYSLEIKKLKTGPYKNKYYPLNEQTGKLIFDKEDLTEYINSLSKNSITINKEEEISDDMRDELFTLLNSSTYDQTQKDQAYTRINSYNTLEQYNKAKNNLLANQLGIEGIINPNQKDISKHLRKTIA